MGKIILYNNIDLYQPEILNDTDWGRKNNIYYTKLHSISSYLAMFTPSLPDYFIDRFTISNDLVMDNFSGRGTTALVCREMKRRFIGTDLNPYSYVLSKFKVSSINKQMLINRVQELREIYKTYIVTDINYKKYNEIKIFYSTNVLKQLIFLRNTLGKNWQYNNAIDNAILAFALGIMHGPSRKDGTTIYFSISMSNAISMSPNYVKKYTKEHNLKKPRLDIFENIINRINKKFDQLLEQEYCGQIYLDNATKNNCRITDNSVSLVITSPPYLNVVNYRLSNWIKLWLLNFEKNELKNKIKLSDNLKFEDYKIFIKDYLDAIHPKLKDGAKVCLIVGDVAKQQLIEEVWKFIKDNVKYRFLELYYDSNYKQNHKVTNSLNSKKGKATLIEKVLVLEKYEN